MTIYVDDGETVRTYSVKVKVAKAVMTLLETADEVVWSKTPAGYGVEIVDKAEEKMRTAAHPQVKHITSTVELDEEQEQIDFVSSHKRLSVLMRVNEDCISRQAVINEIYESHGNFKNEFDQGFFADKIRALPSVIPEPLEMTGEWIPLRDVATDPVTTGEWVTLRTQGEISMPPK